MNGQIAAARAFLEAGNAMRAKAEIQKVLKGDPQNDDALDVLSDALLQLKEFDTLETVSRGRLAADPKCITAYANLLVCMYKKGSRKKAKVLKEQFTAAITDPDVLKKLNQIYDVQFGNAIRSYEEMAEEAAKTGDHRSSFVHSSKAASLGSDLFKAIQDAEFARRTGDNSATNLERLSVLSLRLMRFAKCREYARLTLQQDPTRRLPRELIVLSWLSYLPPFMAAMAALFIKHLTARSNFVLVLLAIYALGLLVALPVFFLLAAISAVLFINPVLLWAAAVAYYVYVGFMLGTASRLLGRFSKKEVKLKDY